MYCPNLKSVVFPVPGLIGGTHKNLGSPWIRPRSLFSKIFHGHLFGWTLLLFWLNLKTFEIIAIGILGGVANPQSWEEKAVGDVRGEGWCRWKERW